MGNSYGVKRHYLITPLETFLTPYFPGVTLEQAEMLRVRRYYNISNTLDSDLHMEYKTVYAKLPGIKKLVDAIVEEHYYITKNIDQNLHYLWHLYYKGTKSGDYRPFILMAEMQILKELSYLTEDEIKNMCVMMESEDLDNLNLVYLSILNLRKQRIEKHGEYNKTLVSDELTQIFSNYAHTILNTEVFMKFFTKINS